MRTKRGRVKVATIETDSRGYMRADGILVGQRVRKGREEYVLIADRDRRRSRQRGTRYVAVRLRDFRDGDLTNSGVL